MLANVVGPLLVSLAEFLTSEKPIASPSTFYVISVRRDFTNLDTFFLEFLFHCPPYLLPLLTRVWLARFTQGASPSTRCQVTLP